MIARMECHSHTHYSNIRLIDSINTPKSLINKAIELGLKGIAITDHEILSGLPEANIYYQEIKKDHPDFKVALGNEIYLTNDREKGQKYYHFILIAKDLIGFKQMCELSSISWMNSYYDRGLERVPTLKKDLEYIIGKNPGHIIASTACIGGELGSRILQMEHARKVGDNETAQFHYEHIIEFIQFCDNLFGNDFYFEVQPGASKEQVIVNNKIAQIAHVMPHKMILTTDAHYLAKEDRYVHEAFLNSKDGEREVASFYEYAYLQTEDECRENLNASIGEMYETLCANTMEIYDKIEDYDVRFPQQIPKLQDKDLIDYPKREAHTGYVTLDEMYRSDNKSERYWVNQCMDRLKEVYPDEDLTEYYEELEKEADIKKTVGKKLHTNIFNYPIVFQHYIDMIWASGSIIGAGRGSAGAGLNHWLLGITQTDPIKMQMNLFERYMNKDTEGLPDIDVDVCPSKRPIIIQKIKQERGQYIENDYDEVKKNLGCSLVATFGTASSKRAVQVAGKGYRSEEFPLGIDSDITTYISSLIPVERGFVYDLHTAYEKVPEFRKEIDQYEGLFKIACAIEGLIISRSSHASGVIMFDENPFEHCAFMKTPKGEIITQFDLGMAEALGSTKYDLLVTAACDKIRITLEFLKQYGYIEGENLREIYYKYLDPMKMDLEDEAVWDRICRGGTLNLFQLESQVGKQGVKEVQPRNINELAYLNGLIRLVPEDGGERPLEKYIKFRDNPQLWEDEMDRYGLSQTEKDAFRKYMGSSYGVCIAQEDFMWGLMDKDITNFSLLESNRARKIISKKKIKMLGQLEKLVKEKAKTSAAGNYAWDMMLGPSKSYGFSILHAKSYSIIGYQMGYLAEHYPTIYWNTACLICNSNTIIDGIDKNIDYAKIATALNTVIDQGINVSLVDINKSDITFVPDEANNKILAGLLPLSNINREDIEKIKANRPYHNIADFLQKVPLKITGLISLVKGGAFDELCKDMGDKYGRNPRQMAMAYICQKASKPKSKLNLINLSSLMKANIIPNTLEREKLAYTCNLFFKKRIQGELFGATEKEKDFLEEEFGMEPVTFDYQKELYMFDWSVWQERYEYVKDKFRDWIQENQDKALFRLNLNGFNEKWQKYGCGNMSSWEMDALCFYHGPHELANVDMAKYGIESYKDMPEIPEVESYWRRGDKQIPLFKIRKIAGTVIAKDDLRSMIYLLTLEGVVPVKINKGLYANMKKQVSEVDETGTKVVVEKGWFKRGTKLVLQGFRRDDNFVCKKYSKTPGHHIYKITNINDDGSIELTGERKEV